MDTVCFAVMKSPRNDSKSFPIQESVHPVQRKSLKIFPFLLAILVVVIDQVTKSIVAIKMAYGQSIPIIGDYLRITFVTNPNALFGISLGERFPYPLLTSAVAIVIAILIITEKSPFLSSAYGVILGGAIGNLIDRLRLGEVIDFIDTGVKNYRWPIFNLADTAVTIGIILMLWFTLIEKRKENTP